MKLLSVILTLFITIAATLRAQDIPDPMSPPRLVNDFAGVFSENQKADLENLLRLYNDTTSTQIYVVTISDLQGYAESDYAARLGEKWGIGQKGKDNGAVILIKPKIGNERGKVFISVGYGLESVLNDARIGRILDNYMIPYLQQNNDYYNGTKATIMAMIAYLSGQFLPDDDQADSSDDALGWIIAIIIFIVLLYILMKKGNYDDDDNSGDRNSSGRGFFPPFFGGRRGSGGFGGGFGGGGFGGGGGGRFGGGGAGRSW